jgi:gamma-glutamyl:cysteine ligase YbdK (ATP-grasp superfamily)
LATLWKGKLSALVFGEAVPPDADSQVWKLAKAEASRTQKIFLDYLLSRVDFTSSHLLDAEFEGVLSQQERLLRDHLRTFLSSVPEEAREAAAWWRLEALHDALGGPRSKEPEE